MLWFYIAVLNNIEASNFSNPAYLKQNILPTDLQSSFNLRHNFSMGTRTKVAKLAQTASASTIVNATFYNARSTLSSCKPKGLAQVISPERPKRASTCKIIGF